MLFKVRGILNFSPEDKTKKHKSQSSWKRTAMINTNCDLSEYYAWFIKKRFNLELNKPLRGTHVTIISDIVDETIFAEASKFFNGKEIDFYLETEPRTDSKHWWLRVYCQDAENIRESIGLSREPYFSFHLTIGYANEKNITHSEYILRQCKRFELISNEGRKPFNEHNIYK